MAVTLDFLKSQRPPPGGHLVEGALLVAFRASLSASLPGGHRVDSECHSGVKTSSPFGWGTLRSFCVFCCRSFFSLLPWLCCCRSGRVRLGIRLSSVSRCACLTQPFGTKQLWLIDSAFWRVWFPIVCPHARARNFTAFFSRCPESKLCGIFPSPISCLCLES